MSEVNEVLEQRQSVYGDFATNANLIQDMLKLIRKANPNLPHTHLEATHMILHKLARMVVGDPNYEDNLIDIQGYAQLLLDYIREQKQL